MLLSGIVAAGMGGVFSTQNRAYMQQDLHVAMGENLRLAMTTVTDALRLAGCGVPPSNLSSWISWAPGFVDAPVVVTDGGGSNPDTLSVADCTPPLAILTVRADAGSTSLVVNATIAGKTLGDLFNTAEKGLIWIGDGDYAVIRRIDDGVVTIDTDPTASGNQGLLRSHPPGTTISRVDVQTFQVQNDSESGLPSLTVDKHQGTVTTAAEGITDFQLTTVTARQRYRVTITGRTEKQDPINGAYLTRPLTSEVTLRN